MKYLKTFNENYEDSINITDGEFDELKNLLREKLDILGIKFTTSRYENTESIDKEQKVPITLCFPKDIKYYSINFGICYTDIKNSILNILSKTISIDKHICPKFKKYIDTSIRTIIICNTEIENAPEIFSTINPKSVQEGYAMVLTQLIKMFENTVSNIMSVGMDYEVNKPIFKTTVINYLKNVLSKNYKPELFSNNELEIVTDKQLYSPIYDYLSNLNDSYKIFNKIKEKNKLLYNQLRMINNKIDTASDMGELGF